MASNKTKSKGRNIKKSLGRTETSYESNNQTTTTFDLSNHKFIVKLSILQIISFFLFTFGLGWFAAANWIFDKRITVFKYEFQEQIKEIIKGEVENKFMEAQ
ncbi:MAG: hypothetical protein UV82_C0011G0072 [Candidatus Magasanikbacteria bacterium GW2011_GWD2_43_18]|nr:MAG: hypothetical protein UV18_C0015G0008 [Candidatus Magasanikbacteria bacterium GW2011_GWC2_42_27]KKT04144.1 MAG: hypothetical protein UV82_C0011G0072 [Candidatus Magasanikbacteria bacterium GW2011_GWD2_43_18]KKT25678.1 MAG: hypothetical protein UW10_C0005G0045 [Candidatus Magasanikbacteria bacterium GW2011_GWA2_43_9]HBB38500.1 hypothetical protein [Candidatus Magasanikbacteria bacterium]HCC13954.1 hypothetical protein [Candidatus Magasanikbacteria bacterium]